ncbi:YraN family protein [Saccharicrinis sp. FJH62]|uniref:YraN family protein n=1 Tax=Saccharicrinis sp. FJH62 TaxID=3344657 RepID=UPI0035D40F3B
MTQNNRKKGNRGEELARIHLQQHGYHILHTNWQFGHKELDIVAEKDDLLVVVEVKSRTTDIFENPEDAVSKKKIRMIIDATEAYLETYDVEMEVRFDVIAVLFQPGKAPEIEHFEDAFISPIW